MVDGWYSAGNSSAVHVTPMADGHNRHGLTIVVDLIDHLIDTDTFSIEWSSHQFFAAYWARMIGQFCNCIVYAPKD